MAYLLHILTTDILPLFGGSHFHCLFSSKSFFFSTFLTEDLALIARGLPLFFGLLIFLETILLSRLAILAIKCYENPHIKKDKFIFSNEIPLFLTYYYDWLF